MKSSFYRDTMTWDFKPAMDVFPAAAKDWDALNCARGNHLLLDSRFINPLLSCFGGHHVLLGINRNSNRQGMALVVKQRPGIWETFQPSQAPVGLIVLGYRDETGEGLLELTRSLPGYALEFAALQQDPDHSCFPKSLNLPGVETVEYIHTPRLSITGTFDDYWNSRSSNLRHNLARRKRRMVEQRLTLELQSHRKPEAVAHCIREYAQLESAGWKGKNGTAVTEDNAQGKFYRAVFENFCDSGEAVIFQWRIDGRLAASDLCLHRDGMMIVLKTAYDEELNQFSPALMMREQIMRDLYQSGTIRIIEFYGRVMDWHTKWCEEVRTMYHVNCFRQPWVAGMRKLIGKFRNPVEMQSGAP